jgi:hypothetical protein
VGSDREGGREVHREEGIRWDIKTEEKVRERLRGKAKK